MIVSKKKKSEKPQPSKRDIEQYLKSIGGWNGCLSKNSLIDIAIDDFSGKWEEEVKELRNHSKNWTAWHYLYDLRKETERKLDKERSKVWDLLRTKGHGKEVIKACDNLRKKIEKAEKDLEEIVLDLQSNNQTKG